MKILSFWALILLLLPYNNTIMAQMSARSTTLAQISGKVVDNNNQAIEFAAISLAQLADKKIVGGAMSDNKGQFVIDNIPLGQYSLQVSFVGFKTLNIEKIEFTTQNTRRDLGNLQLDESGVTLKDVEIKSEKAMFQNQIDRKVFNVDKNLVSQGGTASEVLRQIPSVNLDADNKMSFRGSENVTILVDGKPTTLTSNGNNALDQIPASAIESVEIISNPSAKFDPDGTSGIINIVLKKNRKIGFNGTLTGGIGTGTSTPQGDLTFNKYNASAIINYRNKNVNYFANYSYRRGNNWNFGNFYRQNILTDTTTYFRQDLDNINLSHNHLGKFGADVSFSKNDFLSVTSTLGKSNSTQDQTMFYRSLNANEIVQAISSRATDATTNNFNFDAAANYKHTFAPSKREWSADVYYSTSEEKNNSNYILQNYDLQQQATGSTGTQNSNTQTNSYVLTTQTDYVLPLKKMHKLEMGYKGVYRNISNDFQSFMPTNEFPTLYGDTTFNFNYRENIQAIYTSYTNTHKKLTYQVGIKAEQAFTQANSTETINKQYFNLFPSVFLMQKLPKEQELKLSYSRRINRPSIRSLNPAPDLANPAIFFQGNPNIQPEYIHALEATYAKTWEKISLSATAYFRHTNNVIFRVVDVNNTNGANVAYVKFVNIAKTQNYGVEFINRADIAKWWNLVTTFNVFRAIVDATNINNNSNDNFNGSIRLTSNMNFKKGLAIQVSGNYNTPTAVAQGFIKPFTQVEVGIRKDLWKGKANISANVSDIFNTQQFAINTKDYNFDQEALRKRETRVGNITFTYRFGQSDKDNSKKGGKEKSRTDFKNDEGGGL